MTKEDRSRWDERYADRDIAVEPTAPDAISDAGLLDRVPTTGSALDVACGLGAQSVWLAKRGLAVTAIDVSGEAALRVTAAAQHHGVDDRVGALIVDLDDGLPATATGFDIIVCQRFRDPRLYGEFVDRLVPGGLLVLTVLSESGASSAGPFHAPAGELATAFAGETCTVLFHSEHDGQESIIVERLPDTA